MSKPPVLPPSPLLGLALVMASVAAGLFLALKIGFILHNDPQPPPIDNPILTAIAALILLYGVGTMTIHIVRSFRETLTRVRVRQESHAFAASHLEARRLRVQELAADPTRARYAPLVEAGETWSEEDIAYAEAPQRTITCAHLQPLEQALRQSGIPIRRLRDQQVSATCCIDADALHGIFTLAPPVRYTEFFAGERTEHDHPMAFLICDEHGAIIHTIHPEAPGAKDLLRFPVHTL